MVRAKNSQSAVPKPFERSQASRSPVGSSLPQKSHRAPQYRHNSL